MKKKIKPILLTLILLAGITYGGYYFLTSRDSGPSGELQKRMAEEQSDLGTSRAYRYDMDESAIPLSTSGEKKNVLNFDNTNVYNVQQSNLARERLDRLIKRANADFEKPIIALNPFGTNENSFYFYFTTSYRCMMRYTVTVEDEKINDHIRYVNNGQENNLSKTHEFVVSGLVPGRTNYIILEQLDSTGAKRDAKTYKFTMPKVDVPEQIPVEEGYSKETSKAGMFCVFPKNNQKIYLYDNQGILRNVTQTESAHGSRIFENGDSVIYSIAKDKFTRVSAIGRVLQVVEIPGCNQVKDFTYDGYDEIYLLGRKKGRDILLAASMSTGKRRKVFEFPKGMSLASLSTPSGGTLYLTAAKPWGIVCLDGITSSHPRISYAMGKKADWKKLLGKKKLSQDKEVCSWNTSQSRFSANSNQTYTLLVEKKGQATGLNVQFDKKKKSCKILYTQNMAGKLSNHVQLQGDHMILVNTEEGVFEEHDNLGKVTRKFRFGNGVEGVQKITLDGMCFYGLVS